MLDDKTLQVEPTSDVLMQTATNTLNTEKQYQTLLEVDACLLSAEFGTIDHQVTLHIQHRVFA